MRTTTLLTLIGAAALSVLAGCTVKDVDQPALAGPSTLAHSIVMTADRNTLTQNGVDFVDIRIVSLSPSGQSETIPLTAQIFVDGAAQDFGTLSTKNPVTPTTIRYTAPTGSTSASAQSESVVTISVTPTNAGDFRAETSRQMDLRLIPQGIILPNNPNLKPDFKVDPEKPEILQNVTFDASATTNGGSPCTTLCSYAWNFGDGSTGAGIATTHQFRAQNAYVVQLTVTDARGAQAIAVKTVSVAAGTPPTPDFTFSPTPSVVDQQIFFNASASKAAPGRTIVSYEWDFGKGSGGTGITVSKAYDAPGTYKVTLKVTDDAGSTAVKSNDVVVASAQIQPQFTIEPAAPVVNQPVVVNASSTTSTAPIVSYSWNFGVNSTPATGSGVSASTQYNVAGSKVITLTVTDNAGRTASITKVVTVAP